MNSNPMKPRGNRAQTSTVSTMTMMPTHRLWPNDQLNRLETQLPNLLIISSNHSIILSQSFLSSRVSILPKREVKSGTNVSAASKLNRIANTITPQNFLNISDTNE